jgi:sugar phosphate isomerase/epimerase
MKTIFFAGASSLVKHSTKDRLPEIRNWKRNVNTVSYRNEGLLMKLACSSITFGELDKESECIQMLRDIKNAGYEALQIEHRFLPKSLRKDPLRVAELVSDAGLKSVAVAVTTNPYTVRFTKEVDGKVGTLCLFEKEKRRALSQALKIAKLSRKAGVALAIHPHIQSDVQTIQEVEMMLAHCKEYSPKLVFDTAHFTALGWDLHNFIARFHNSIAVAHIKDLRTLKSPDRISFLHDFIDVGDGIIDFRKVIYSLRQFRFRGWLVVEIDYPQEKTAVKSIRKNFERLSRLL